MNRVDEIEKAMIEGFEDDATDVLEAFIEYLQEIKKGETKNLLKIYIS